MIRLGTVTSIYRNKLVIVEALPGKRPPNIGHTLLLADGTPVGRVVDVIGPVERPYILVLPHPRFRPHRLVDKTLYYRAPRKSGGAKAHARRRGGAPGRRRHGGPRRRLRGRSSR